MHIEDEVAPAVVPARSTAVLPAVLIIKKGIAWVKMKRTAQVS